MPDKVSFEPQPSSSGGGVSDVTASPPIASTGGATPDISLSGIVGLAHGGLGADSSSVNQNRVLASPNGSAGAPTFRALVAADLPANIPSFQVYEGIIAGALFGGGTVVVPPGMAVAASPLTGSSDYTTFVAGEAMTLVLAEVMVVPQVGNSPSGTMEVRRFSGGWSTIASVPITLSGTVESSGALSVAVAQNDNIGVRVTGIPAWQYLWVRVKFRL